MKALVSPLAAYFCVLTSVFGIVILCILGAGFKQGWESLMGTTDDPQDGDAVAVTLFLTVAVFAAFLVFCGCQIAIIQRRNRIQL